MPKRRPDAPRKPVKRPASACLWLVPFSFHRPKTNCDGTFQMIVEGTSPDDAM